MNSSEMPDSSDTSVSASVSHLQDAWLSGLLRVLLVLGRCRACTCQ